MVDLVVNNPKKEELPRELIEQLDKKFLASIGYAQLDDFSKQLLNHIFADEELSASAVLYMYWKKFEKILDKKSLNTKLSDLKRLGFLDRTGKGTYKKIKNP